MQLLSCLVQLSSFLSEHLGQPPVTPILNIFSAGGAPGLSFASASLVEELARALQDETVHLTHIERKEQTGVSKAACPCGLSTCSFPL